MRGAGYSGICGFYILCVDFLWILALYSDRIFVLDIESEFHFHFHLICIVLGNRRISNHGNS